MGNPLVIWAPNSEVHSVVVIIMWHCTGTTPARMHTSPTAVSPLLGRWYPPPLPAASGLAHQLATQFPNLTAQQAQSILASMRSLSSAQHLQAATHTQPQASQRTTSEGVTPIDSIVTAATALGNPYTKEGWSHYAFFHMRP